jgi:Ca2+-binding EF-hand superfamily protein
LPSEYIYTEIFKAFDVDNSGYIDKLDLETASAALGWKDHQGKLKSMTNILVASDLVMELDPNHDGKITHEEFILIMKYIEQKG